jgi:TolB protein
VRPPEAETLRGLFILIAASVALAAHAEAPERIVFGRIFPNAGQVGLFIAAADGSEERPLLAPSDIDYDPAWSPDGLSIVFTSERGGSADLFRVKPDGSALEQLTDSAAYDDQAAFSPDGRHVVFVSTRGDGTADLWTLDLQTRRAKPLTSGPGGDFRPSWSPDGKSIAFSSDRDSTLPNGRGRWEHLHVVALYVIRPDGSGLRRVTEPGDFCGSPKWLPDSRHVVAYCMTAEDTLMNRRAAPDAGSDTRLVSIDTTTGAFLELEAPEGVKIHPSPLSGNDFGYVRKPMPGTEPGIYYTSGKSGPKGDVRTASWSPDATRVVFHKKLAAPLATWTKTFSRDPDYELTLAGGFMPSFNPSGDRYVTNSRRNQMASPFGSALMLAAPGADTFDVIYREDRRNVLAPQWSPRGDAIIFGFGGYNGFFNGIQGRFIEPEDRVEGGAQIAIVNPDGSGFRELTSGANNNGFPSMSPDGERFVYRTFGPAGDGLRVMNIGTSAVTTLVSGYANFPSWSPRGDLIAFAQPVDGDYEIFTIRPDGTSLKRLTTARGNDGHMAWSPDGEYLVFSTSRMGFKDEVTYTDSAQPYGELFVMRYDGTRLQQLTDNQWEDGAPGWQPTALTPAARRRRP